MKITPISHIPIDTQTVSSETLNLKELGKFYCFYSTEYDTNIWYNSEINAQSANNDRQITDDPLLNIIKNRGIKWLYHFTPKSNITDILNNGLKTRDLIPINAKVTDNYRFDKYSNAICLSIGKPNSWMLKRKQNDGLDLCLLLVDSSILINKKCAFFPHNAATACYRKFSFEEMTGADRFEAMFAPSVSIEKANGSINTFTRKTYFLDCEPTSDQAEIQCCENIESKYIHFIIMDNFPINASDLQKLAETLTEQKLKENSTISNLPYLGGRKINSKKEESSELYHREIENLFNSLVVRNESTNKKDNIQYTNKIEEEFAEPLPEVVNTVVDDWANKTEGKSNSTFSNTTNNLKRHDYKTRSTNDRDTFSPSSSFNDGCATLIIIAAIIIWLLF